MADSISGGSEVWRTFDHAKLEREYSPSSCVPNGDLGPFIQQYIDRSATARTRVQADATFAEIRYGDATSQTIDVATPAWTDRNTPLIVFIHGGYWQQLSKHESFFAAADSVERGIAFAAVDYTLAPEASLDEIVRECHDALGALRSRAIELGVDPDRVFVAGSSAGAHLAAMVALGTSQDTWRPAGCCLVSGIFDLQPLVNTYVNDAVGLEADDALRNSPLHLNLDGFPPTVVAVGSNETNEFKRQSTAMSAALSDVGTVVEQLEITERNHFDIILDLCDDHAELGAALFELVDSTA